MDLPKIAYEDSDFLIVNKPAGLLVHQIKGGKGETLVDWLLERYPEIRTVGDQPDERPGIVHRLDRDTSGVIVVARNKNAFDYLKKLFESGEVRKKYLCLVLGRVTPPFGIIDKPIGLKSGTTKRTAVLKKVKMVKPALTAYKTLRHGSVGGAEVALLEVFPKTGRTHQIRVHLNSIGHPVIGDALYGRSKRTVSVAESLGLKRQFLHAESIEFTGPKGERVAVSVDLSEDLALALEKVFPGKADLQSRS